MGIFLDFVRLTTRAEGPHGGALHVRTAKRNRIDRHLTLFERLFFRYRECEEGEPAELSFGIMENDQDYRCCTIKATPLISGKVLQDLADAVVEDPLSYLYLLVDALLVLLVGVIVTGAAYIVTAF